MRFFFYLQVEMLPFVPIVALNLVLTSGIREHLHNFGRKYIDEKPCLIWGRGEVCPTMNTSAINVPKRAKGQTAISIKMQNFMIFH